MGWVFRRKKKQHKDLRKYVKWRPSWKNLNSHKIQTTCLIKKKKYSGFLTYDYKGSIIDMGKTESQNTSNYEASLGKTDET